MKICLITTNLFPVPATRGGAVETLMSNLIKVQEEKNKVALTMVSLFEKDAYELSKSFKNTKFIYIKKNFIYIIYSLIFHFINKVFKKNYHTYNYLAMRKIKNIKFDYIFVEGGHYESFNNYLKYFDKNKMVLHLHHKAESNEIIDKTFSKIIGVSKFVCDDFKETSSIKNYYVLKNSIDVNSFSKNINSKEKNNIRSKYGFNNDDFILIYCGRLIKEKGVLELASAINKINNKKIKLMIVGSVNFKNGGISDYTLALDEQIKKSDGRIVMTGFIDNNELYKYYRSCDGMVIPSLWKEAAGLVCLEGQMCSLPIITTGSGGIKEFVFEDNVFVNNDSDIIVNLEEAIVKLYNNRDEYKKTAFKNVEYAKAFNIEKYYDDFVDIIYNQMKGC